MNYLKNCITPEDRIELREIEISDAIERILNDTELTPWPCKKCRYSEVELDFWNCFCNKYNYNCTAVAGLRYCSTLRRLL